MARNWDVLIVGAGTAGLPAALFSAARGASVIVVESADCIGGTLHLSTGSFSAAGTVLQKDAGIADTPEAHFEDCRAITNGTGDKAITRLWVDNAASTFDWLIEAGLDVTPDLLSPGAPHELYKTSRIVTPKGNGHAYLDVLKPMFMDGVERGAITLMLNTAMSALVQDEHGTAIGASIRLPNGRASVVHAKNTVLTCGGFSANANLWKETHNKPHRVFPNPCASGQGHGAATSIGAHLAHEKSHLPSFGGTRNIDDNTFGFHTMTLPQFRPPWEIYVNSHGKRFMAEDDASPDRRERLLKDQPGEEFWCIYDQAVKDSAPPFFMWDAEMIERAFATHDDFQVANSLTELANQCGIPQDALMQTVDNYNAGRTKSHDSFNRRYMPRPMTLAPFYAAKHYGVSVLSFAGLEIDATLRIIGTDGNPIPNLYGAGEILGMGVFGHAYLGGAMVSSAMTFGHLLGQDLLQWQ